MICIISGTNRPDSQTFKVAKLFESLFQKAGAKTDFLDLKNLPAALFTPEAYATKPAEFEVFSEKVLKSHGLFVVTPEYNGSFPGVLKTFIDHLKFPQSFERRPVAFCGVAAGMWGALRSVEQLELIFKYRNAFTFSERIFLPKIHEQFDEQNNFKIPLTKTLVDSQVKNFILFCNALRASLPAAEV